jgi:hypothetical protein
MIPERPRFMRSVAVVALAAGLVTIIGCGVVTQPRIYEVKGKVELVGGDVRQLAGGHVEAVLPSDRRVTATGEIREDGSFTLQTYHAGQTLEGVQQGTYEARIVLTDEDSGHKLRRGPVLAPRFSKFTSGLTINVPSDDVVLKVTRQ